MCRPADFPPYLECGHADLGPSDQGGRPFQCVDQYEESTMTALIAARSAPVGRTYRVRAPGPGYAPFFARQQAAAEGLAAPYDARVLHVERDPHEVDLYEVTLEDVAEARQAEVS